MKKETTLRTVQDRLDDRRHEKELFIPASPKRIPGVEIPGYGGHFQPLAVQKPLAGSPPAWKSPRDDHPDPGFWKRGGARWLHTKRRGGQIGRQRDRRLSLPPIPG